MEEIIVNAGMGAIGGVIFGLVAYFKNKRQNEYFTDFDMGKFMTSVAASAVIGGGAGYTGIAPDAFAASAYGVVLTQLARKAVGLLQGKKE